MKTYILKRPDCEWCDVLTVTWSSLEDYVNHINNTYEELMTVFSTEISTLRKDFLEASKNNRSDNKKWWAFCHSSRQFLENTIRPWLSERNINYKWFHSVESVYWYYDKNPKKHVPFTVDTFGILVISFDSSLSKGIVEIC